MHSAFANVKMLQFMLLPSPNISGLFPESQDNCGSGGMRFTAIRWLPHMDIGQPPFQEQYGSIQKYTNDCVCTY
jgi:hypothetical protein